MDAVPVQGGALLGKGHELAPPCRAHAAGSVLREVAHAHLPHCALLRRDDRTHIPLPPGGGGAGKIYDHAAGAVHTGSAGVRVAGLAAHAVHRHRKGVITAVLVAGQIDAPHALRPAFQRQGAHAHAAIALAVKVHTHALSCRCPQTQPRAGKGILRPKRPGTGGVPGKGVALEQFFQFSGGSGTHGFLHSFFLFSIQ